MSLEFAVTAINYVSLSLRSPSRSNKFYLTGDMMNLYPFIRDSLEQSFSELFRGYKMETLARNGLKSWRVENFQKLILGVDDVSINARTYF